MSYIRLPIKIPNIRFNNNFRRFSTENEKRKLVIRVLTDTSLYLGILSFLVLLFVSRLDELFIVDPQWTFAEELLRLMEYTRYGAYLFTFSTAVGVIINSQLISLDYLDFKKHDVSFTRIVFYCLLSTSILKVTLLGIQLVFVKASIFILLLCVFPWWTPFLIFRYRLFGFKENSAVAISDDKTLYSRYLIGYIEFCLRMEKKGEKKTFMTVRDKHVQLASNVLKMESCLFAVLALLSGCTIFFLMGHNQLAWFDVLYYWVLIGILVPLMSHLPFVFYTRIESNKLNITESNKLNR